MRRLTKEGEIEKSLRCSRHRVALDQISPVTGKANYVRQNMIMLFGESRGNPIPFSIDEFNCLLGELARFPIERSESLLRELWRPEAILDSLGYVAESYEWNTVLAGFSMDSKAQSILQAHDLVSAKDEGWLRVDH